MAGAVSTFHQGFSAAGREGFRLAGRRSGSNGLHPGLDFLRFIFGSFFSHRLFSTRSVASFSVRFFHRCDSKGLLRFVFGFVSVRFFVRSFFFNNLSGSFFKITSFFCPICPICSPKRRRQALKGDHHASPRKSRKFCGRRSIYAKFAVSRAFRSRPRSQIRAVDVYWHPAPFPYWSEPRSGGQEGESQWVRARFNPLISSLSGFCAAPFRLAVHEAHSHCCYALRRA